MSIWIWLLNTKTKMLSCKIFVIFIISTQFLSDAKQAVDDGTHTTHHRPDEPDISASHEQYEKDGQFYDNYDHDAITGSHHETEEFKELEPEEAKKRLGILFDQMDANKDSNLNKDELFHWIISSFKKLDKENAEQRIEEYDENHDKLVSWDEYARKTFGHNANELEDMLKSPSPELKAFLDGVRLDKMKFELADHNNDSQLNIDELTAFLHPQNYPEMRNYELARTLEDFDKNKDGVLDLKEFLGDEKLDKESEEHERKSFEEHDKNKNNILEHDEIIEWAMPGFDKTAHAEVEHLFNETDVNKDNLLTKEEVINQHELWVGSHATDYGKHLDDLKPHEEL